MQGATLGARETHKDWTRQVAPVTKYSPLIARHRDEFRGSMNPAQTRPLRRDAPRPMDSPL